MLKNTGMMWKKIESQKIEGRSLALICLNGNLE